MKKLIIVLTLSLFSTLITAKEVVTLIYPWSMGDPMAQYSRSLVDEANKLQNRYTFVLDNKPGAGGTIAARHVANTPNTILAASTAFFVRPNFFPQDSHDVANFKPLMTQCAVPMVVSSNKYQRWEQVPKDQIINIGISGLGATTHLIAMQIKNRYPLIQPIPYKSTRDSTLDLAGQRIDLNVGFPGEIEQWVNQGKIFALGVTGTKPINNIATLQSQGFTQMGAMVNGHSLIVPASLSDHTYQEWRNILLKAEKTTVVQQSYAVDHCDPLIYNQKQTNDWYQGQTKLWNTLSRAIKIELK